MSLESAVLFWQNVQADRSLQDKLKPVRENPQGPQPDAAAEIAQSAGYSVTADELIQMESVLKFWSDVQEDPDLQGKLQGAQESESEEDALTTVMQAAQGAGYNFPKEALSTVTGALAEFDQPGGRAELSEKELGHIVGGAAASSTSTSISRALSGGFKSIAKHSRGHTWSAHY